MAEIPGWVCWRYGGSEASNRLLVDWLEGKCIKQLTEAGSWKAETKCMAFADVVNDYAGAPPIRLRYGRTWEYYGLRAVAAIASAVLIAGAFRLLTGHKAIIMGDGSGPA